MDIKKIRCLVVDDEPPALAVIQEYISRIPALELAGSCINAVEALEIIRQEIVDLLFLDIQMPQILGTDFVRAIKNPPKVIFTTAFRKFAIEGFELDATDYLLKPISFERFLKAVNKVMQVPVTSAPVPLKGETKKEFGGAFIHFRSDRKVVKIPLNDILYLESLRDYVKVVTTRKTIIGKHSMSALEEILPKESFARIHRSYIISLDRIESYTSDMVEIAKQELPVSRMYRHELARIINMG